MPLTTKARLQLFRTMLRIRRVQERIESEYMKDEMKTPVHLYIGQEAIASGVCSSLRDDDAINSNHRSHGHYLAKGGDLNAMMAELFCKSTGCSRGYGGSMHLVDVAHGNMGTSAIVGGGIPIATGQGLAFQMQKLDRVSAVFFGDGAADEGTLYESVNFAMLKQLPVVYVMENNGWAVCSPTATRHCGDNVFHKGAGDRLFTAKIDGNDPELVFDTAEKAVAHARSGQGPAFIECVTYRILGHAGCLQQDPKGYRDPAEIELWRERCPVCTYQRKLLELGVLSHSLLTELEAVISAEIDAAFEFARTSPLPTADVLHNHLFCE
ncbi:MAG: thiamine pyrophosphate-dependent dehydrogenase E1 component subunit alpha [Humidesulfovibrio sp.]|uniref:thiamine pyrophosphate-dependent dehydrogenase E1 component subunit alpha n=1 Tax=Humidesulfovibrio sp. TaxID=2910988 RepID=UPI002734FA5D|nr:thiamine pyrophosphate-dependent dehydrogenase E1 component subunit alpha [Humidesulfovibrio sp.]MDP2847926.1 thiamine pyrophosphate-dependent dehydrogenase E1 component subunit alpha [Humidesulfovibrio sp.]